MAKFRMVRTDFWKNPIVSEEMTPEDKYFYLYLLTNPQTTQIGIYKITKKQMAFDLGYSIESVHSLMERFISHHKLIRYNPETRELAMKNWGKHNLDRGGKPMMDCIFSELRDVEDLSLIQYVSEAIQKQEIRNLFESFCKQEELIFDNEVSGQEEKNTYLESESGEHDDTLTHRDTRGGQKEEENEKEIEKEKQQQEQKAFHPNCEYNPEFENPLKSNQNDVKEIMELWDNNGFGFSNVNAKQQLLAWLDDSRFLQPKDVILKAMNIACANNKRRLSYVVGILKNWENESLLTVGEIDSYHENQKSVPKHRQATESFKAGRDIPSGFEYDPTAGEED
ncbi:DnaD domain protein [Neobacillus vireti]|uniref:Primosome, DnaD subunit n=1 Tax=Neobacillus vireti LMG 21834 TaxID=1131730 RepID=A0AB94IQU2_9BACI|nr:DnaD domain protein [Neobacillus vireti]ETI69455.1 primosome, DnaD subunit [Neobacillus vireti LMG 21834]KLT18920.1 primosome, DnaD subunit [Neobacillus vireti]